MIESPILISGAIAGCVALAFWLDFKVAALSKVGASLMTIVFGAVLANAGWVPIASPVYDAVWGPVTSLAIAWLLLAVDMSDLKRVGGPMLGAFALAVLGTATGALIGAFVFAGTFGEDTWRLGGTLMGTYSGGGLNFVAVGRGLELSDSLFAGAIAADNLTTGLWLGATLLLPLWLKPFFPTPIPGGTPGGTPGGAPVGAPGGSDESEAVHPFFGRVPVSTLDLGTLAAVGMGLVILSEWVGTLIPVVPPVLWLTTFALIVGHLRWFRGMPGAMQLGTLALHFFFVVIGIFSRVSEILAAGVEVLFFTLVVVGVQGVVVFGIGRLAKLDVGTLSVASQAAVGGPSSALAVAVSREWPGLMLPGIIVGLLGYAVGNYLGFGVAYLLRSMGVGF